MWLTILYNFYIYVKKILSAKKYSVCPKSITEKCKTITKRAKTDVYLTQTQVFVDSCNWASATNTRVPYHLTPNFLQKRQNFDLENI